MLVSIMLVSNASLGRRMPATYYLAFHPLASISPPRSRRRLGQAPRKRHTPSAKFVQRSPKKRAHVVDRGGAPPPYEIGAASGPPPPLVATTSRVRPALGQQSKRCVYCDARRAGSRAAAHLGDSKPPAGRKRKRWCRLINSGSAADAPLRQRMTSWPIITL